MKNFIYFGLILFGIFAIASSCSEDEPDDNGDGNTCVTTNLTYNINIKSIIDSNCALPACHSSAQASTTGSLDGYAAVSDYASQSVFLRAIKHENNATAMPYPPDTPMLSDCNISKIEAWINDGLPE